MNEKYEVSEKIRQQLGGVKFDLLTGAKDFMTRGFDLQFRLPAGKAKDKINMVKIELCADDTYMIKFYNYNPFKCIFKEIECLHEIQCTNLKHAFSYATGMEI